MLERLKHLKSTIPGLMVIVSTIASFFQFDFSTWETIVGGMLSAIISGILLYYKAE